MNSIDRASQTLCLAGLWPTKYRQQSQCGGSGVATITGKQPTLAKAELGWVATHGLDEMCFLLDSRLMKPLAIRLGCQKTTTKSLVMRGNDGLMDYLG